MRKTSVSGSYIFGSAASGGMVRAASAWAISPSFHASRCNCQTPSDIMSANAMSVISVGIASRRRMLIIADSSRFQPVMHGEQPRLDAAQEQDRQQQDERRPDHHMHPQRRMKREFHHHGQKADQHAAQHDDEKRRAVAQI